MTCPTFFLIVHTIASAGDIYFQLVLKILLFEVYQYVIDRFQNKKLKAKNEKLIFNS